MCLKLDTPSDSPLSSQGLAVAEAAAALKPADAAPAAVSKKRPAEGDAGADGDPEGAEGAAAEAQPAKKRRNRGGKKKKGGGDGGEAGAQGEASHPPGTAGVVQAAAAAAKQAKAKAAKMTTEQEANAEALAFGMSNPIIVPLPFDRAGYVIGSKGATVC